jgi:hypothetical protein
MSETKTAITELVEKLEMQPVPPENQAHGDLPHVVANGTLKLFGLEIAVVQLSDGRRVVPMESIGKVLGEQDD